MGDCSTGTSDASTAVRCARACTGSVANPGLSCFMLRNMLMCDRLVAGLVPASTPARCFDEVGFALAGRRRGGACNSVAVGESRAPVSNFGLLRVEPVGVMPGERPARKRVADDGRDTENEGVVGIVVVLDRDGDRSDILHTHNMLQIPQVNWQAKASVSISW